MPPDEELRPPEKSGNPDDEALPPPELAPALLACEPDDELDDELEADCDPEEPLDGIEGMEGDDDDDDGIDDELLDDDDDELLDELLDDEDEDEDDGICGMLLEDC
mgnify:CR=1 FL=1